MLPTAVPGTASGTSPLTFAAWSDHLRARGLQVLPQSHAVPVDLWARDATAARVLHLRARGTRVVLRSYDGSAFTTVLLRAECDCEQHRAAGAAGRVVLTPGARPEIEVVYDGAAELGWTGVAAGRLSVPEAAALFDALLDELVAAAVDRATDPGAGASTVQPHLFSWERSRRCAPSPTSVPAVAG